MNDRSKKLQQVLLELKAEYLLSLPKKIELIDQYGKSEDWDLLSQEYHKLKGTGKTYGFPEVSMICEKLEDLSIRTFPEKQKFLKYGVSILNRLCEAYKKRQSVALEKDPEAQEILKYEIKGSL